MNIIIVVVVNDCIFVWFCKLFISIFQMYSMKWNEKAPDSLWNSKSNLIKLTTVCFI